MNICMQDLQNLEKMKFLMRIKYGVDGLAMQISRINELFNVLDADIYIIILRRLYREIEDCSSDARIAKIIRQNKSLFEKIKIRDHFEHNIETKKSQLYKNRLAEIGINCDSGASVNIMTSMFRKSDTIVIVSGNIEWNLQNDHKKFLEIIEMFVILYPFNINKSLKKTCKEIIKEKEEEILTLKQENEKLKNGNMLKLLNPDKLFRGY